METPTACDTYSFSFSSFLRAARQTKPREKKKRQQSDDDDDSRGHREVERAQVTSGFGKVRRAFRVRAGALAREVWTVQRPNAGRSVWFWHRVWTRARRVRHESRVERVMYIHRKHIFIIVFQFISNRIGKQNRTTHQKTRLIRDTERYIINGRR